MASLVGLFLVAFSAATLLPGGSELAFLAMASQSGHATLTLLITVSFGNILGSVLNYWLGRAALHYQHRTWFPISQTALLNAQVWFKRWGSWSVLLAWVPLIGDPITMIAGVLRMNFWVFLVLVSLSKTLRYMALLGVVGFLSGL